MYTLYMESKNFLKKIRTVLGQTETKKVGEFEIGDIVRIDRREMEKWNKDKEGKPKLTLPSSATYTIKGFSKDKKYCSLEKGFNMWGEKHIDLKYKFPISLLRKK